MTLNRYLIQLILHRSLEETKMYLERYEISAVEEREQVEERGGKTVRMDVETKFGKVLWSI